jgi:hypothetical protein
VYHNFPGTPYGDMLVSDAILASCAAPTLLPKHSQQLDGALFAPSPGLHALLMLLQSHPQLTTRQVGVLCIGTHVKQPTPPPQKAGLLWYVLHARQAIHLAMHSNRQSIHRHLRTLLGDRCCIVDIAIPAALGDAWDPRNVSAVVNVGRQQPLVLPWLQRHFP